RRFRIKPGVDTSSIAISGNVIYQICNPQTCVPDQEFKFEVGLDGPVLDVVDASTSTSGANDAAPLVTYFDQLVGPLDAQTVGSRWQVLISPRQVKAGGEV